MAAEYFINPLPFLLSTNFESKLERGHQLLWEKWEGQALFSRESTPQTP